MVSINLPMSVADSDILVLLEQHKTMVFTILTFRCVQNRCQKGSMLRKNTNVHQTAFSLHQVSLFGNLQTKTAFYQ